MTRVSEDPFGAYPLQGVAFDFYMGNEVVGNSIQNHEDPDQLLYPLLSLPFDLVIDVILLPADLIAWPLGYEKGFDLNI